MERRLIVPVLLFLLGAGFVIAMGVIAGRRAVERQASQAASPSAGSAGGTADSTVVKQRAQETSSSAVSERKPRSPSSTPVPYQVAGTSMAPTLMPGDLCLIDEFQSISSASPTDARWPASPTVQMASLFRAGDIITIDYQADQHIKRVAAIEGDVVDLVEGRLLVNGIRLEDWIRHSLSAQGVSLKDAVIETHENSPCHAPIPPALVRLQSKHGRWSALSDGWWLYQYLNPYQAGRVTVLNDDYPLNQKQHRQLYPVDRLAIHIEPMRLPVDSDSSVGEVEVAMLAGEQQWKLQVAPDGWASSQPPAASTSLAESLVSSMRSEQSQVAIRLPKGSSWELSQAEGENGQLPFVSLYRQIHYRDDCPSLDYPVTLKPGQVFVVGDNVPVSVDSRTWGPLSLENVTGRLRLLRRQDDVSEKTLANP